MEEDIAPAVAICMERVAPSLNKKSPKEKKFKARIKLRNTVNTMEDITRQEEEKRLVALRQKEEEDDSIIEKAIKKRKSNLTKYSKASRDGTGRTKRGKDGEMAWSILCDVCYATSVAKTGYHQCGDCGDFNICRTCNKVARFRQIHCEQGALLLEELPIPTCTSTRGV